MQTCQDTSSFKNRGPCYFFAQSALPSDIPHILLLNLFEVLMSSKAFHNSLSITVNCILQKHSFPSFLIYFPTCQQDLSRLCRSHLSTRHPLAFWFAHPVQNTQVWNYTNILVSSFVFFFSN